MRQKTRKGLAVIYRQEIIQDITFFTVAPKDVFYDKLFLNLDLSDFPEYLAKTSRDGYSKRVLLCAFIVMKCECFSCITDLLDYLQNNLLIAHYCGFNIMKPLPSYWTLDRFIRNLDNSKLKNVMKNQVLKLSELLHLSVLIQLRYQPTPQIIIRNPLRRTSFQNQIILHLTKTADLVSTLLPIRLMNANLNTTRVTESCTG